MHRPERLAGVILAGGRSSRMGQNKALLDFRGRPLLEQMESLLRRCGCGTVLISGLVPGYPGRPDEAPWQGPARALDALMRELEEPDALLVVPVDMPFLPVAALRHLIAHGNSCCFERRPLPALIRLPARPTTASSMDALLRAQHADRLPLPEHWQAGMINLNTPEQWREATGNEPASGH